jgi:hypothetical protein
LRKDNNGSFDGGGLPFADNKTIDAWRAEALRELPQPNDWADFIAMLRHSAELDRQGYAHPGMPENATGCVHALKAVISLLQRQPGLMRRGDLALLLRLHGALVDLAAGRASPIFKPVHRAAGAPGKGATFAHIQGLAARALAELVDGGMPVRDAAQRVARALKTGRKDMGDVTPETIINWRERIEQGPGPGAPEDAIRSFLEPLPPSMGDTPLKRGNNLVKVLKERSAMLG